jgi:starch phosphorylase
MNTVLSRAGSARAASRSSDAWSELNRVAENLWWSWDCGAQRLFAGIDPPRWELHRHNPILQIQSLQEHRASELADDAYFAAQARDCAGRFDAYMRARTWFQRTARGRDRRMLVAYFCAEYALHESFPQYSGGLGVLAGDHLKSASDLGVPLVAVGLLYRRGYYQQSFAPDGSTRVTRVNYEPAQWPLSKTGVSVTVEMGRRRVVAQVWRVHVGRVTLLLLDADVRANRPADRRLTEDLYGGDNEYRIRQEMLLGIGGVRALQAMGVRPSVYHLNEGHAAFCALERLRQEVSGGRGVESAVERVRASTLFTTHTPVPAGHDRFDRALFMRHFGDWPAAMGMEAEELLALGRENPSDPRETFCITVLALLLSGRVNGVSRLHAEVTRAMWKRVYGLEDAKRVPIGHVTNGIHSQTWLAPEIEPLYRRYLKPKWVGTPADANCWQRADRIPDNELWATRCLLRRKLVHFVRQRLLEQAQRGFGPIEEIIAAYETFDENVLTMGFARRFATYKRATLLFDDPRRLSAILNHSARPVQIVFAGKAHPRDAAGQALAQRIYQFCRRSGLRGRIALLENYEMDVGRVLTSGCDVWLNNPLRPQEASGTSGMKPPLHGGLNLSILDGWWPEAYNGRNGWAIDHDRAKAGRRTGRNAGAIADPPKSRTTDRRDAGALYDLLERQVIPLFYRRGRNGVPSGWVKRMKASMKSVCGRFNSHRMVGEYVERYYLPAHRAAHG